MYRENTIIPHTSQVVLPAGLDNPGPSCSGNLPSDPSATATAATATGRTKNKQQQHNPSNNTQRISLDKWHYWGFNKIPSKRTNTGEPIQMGKDINNCKDLSIGFSHDVGVFYHPPNKDHGFLIEKRLKSGESIAICLGCQKNYVIKPCTLTDLHLQHWESRYCIIIEDEVNIIKCSEIQKIKSTIPSIQIRTILLAPTVTSYSYQWYPRS